MSFYSGQNGRLRAYDAATGTGTAQAVAIVNAGTGFTDETKTAVATTNVGSGTGTGLTVDFTVVNGEITNPTVNAAGSGYADDEEVNITGYSGAKLRVIRRAPRTLAKVTSWSLQTSAAVLSTTTLGDTDNTSTYGVRSSQGSCRIFYYKDGSKNDCSYLLNKLLKVRTDNTDPTEAGVADAPEPVRLCLDIMDGSTPKTFDFSALITSANMTMNVGEVVAAEIQFTVQGAFRGLTVLN